MKRGRERSISLSSSSSNSTFYVNLVEEVPQDVFPVRIEFPEHFVLDEEDEDAFLEDETDCGDTLSELSCSNSQRLDGYGSGEYRAARGSPRVPPGLGSRSPSALALLQPGCPST
ncbi:uncharacterized protein LOC122254148 [Penaeus japonicus]|uniref:uncharacterized protein LOC122254148 n=1 Tax=Penaeus japonicus TaxID=27405 RepID=UPI001C716184|nr:uncharacterized protein LOC122254148 [Penaeus japonicus]XP_042873618.1 uncharacterized protein LOC122254148 [Penaeus japonicus]XP_042873619.1 uncharacterized protein LOC122254148 [Penaeus japonicus]XP_042873620.1 uncharacterized protein LOC122254148 [Penaeus japonicus]XP_042873621.1 uncharacterized protein LOC122254148 [Penaeus japonicus]